MSFAVSCYFAPGEKSKKTAPCNHTALANGQHTQCCEPGDLCLTNGLCREETVNDITNYAWRFGCTDETFKDPSCGTEYCDAKLAGSGKNAKLVWKCPQDNTWCCSTGDDGPQEYRANRTNTTCCTIDDLVFKASNPTIFATASIYGSLFPLSTLLPSSFALANATLSRSSTTTTPSPTDGLGFSNSASPTAAPQNRPSTLSIGLGAGLGSFAAIVLSIGSFCLWRRRRRTTESPRSETPAKELSDHGLAEASSQDRAEMTGMGYRRELTSPVSPVELWSPTSPVVRSELPGEEKGRCVIAETDGKPRHEV